MSAKSDTVSIFNRDFRYQHGKKLFYKDDVQLIVDQPVHTIEINIHGPEVVLSAAKNIARKS